jgi:hypothetical protein
MPGRTATKAYSGTCDRGHPERRVTLLLRNSNKHNDQGCVWVRCGECNGITKCTPNADLLTEYMTDGDV